MRSTPILLTALALLASCGEVRPQASDYLAPPTSNYQDDIAPLFADKCVSCHGEDSPAGGYRLTGWRELLRPGRDRVPNAIAGDAESKLITVLAGDAEHVPLLDDSERALVRRWLVDDRMAYFSRESSGVHPVGWLNSADRNAETFHGGYLRKSAWDMASCKRCHGDDFSGGKAKASCTSCHAGGPTACTTCHGDSEGQTAAPPSDLSGNFDPTLLSVGLHAKHRLSTIGRSVECSACHLEPKTFERGVGHLFDSARPSSDLRAEVTFGALAKGTAAGLDLKPSYDRETGACTNVYCHAFGASGKEWIWNKPLQGGLGCTGCHSWPPTKTRSGAQHPSGTVCEACHSKAFKDGAINPEKHINGTVEVF